MCAYGTTEAALAKIKESGSSIHGQIYIHLAENADDPDVKAVCEVRQRW